MARSTTHRTALDDTQPTVPGSHPRNGAPLPTTEDASAHADPIPASVPDAALSSAMTDDREGGSSPVGSDTAGPGRPTKGDAASRFLGVGIRLAGLGVPPPQFLAVLHRIPLGRAQRHLDAYTVAARDLGATDREAHLVLTAIEQTITAAQPVGRLDPYQLAGDVLAAAAAVDDIARHSNGGAA